MSNKQTLLLTKKTGTIVSKVFLGITTWVLMLIVIGGTYTFGYLQGKYETRFQQEETRKTSVSSIVDNLVDKDSSQTASTETSVSEQTTQSDTLGTQDSGSWGGPDLWAAVNKRRSEYGVNSLIQRDNLCTIAAVRLNELLELDKLDGHEGFLTINERRPDLAYVFKDYSTVAEFLASGGESAEATVQMWENSLGHKKIVMGGEYVWGCIYAQDTFAVAITAY